MRDEKKLVSFVVLSWNTLEDTVSCIDNIKQQNIKSKEIIVVDNGSTDGSKDTLSTINNIIYIDLKKNTGFTGGQLAAFEKCSGEYIALINSDAVIDKNWAQTCLDTFNNHKKAGAVGGKAFAWDKKNPVYSTKNSFYSYQKVNQKFGYSETMQCGEDEIKVDSISGAAVMISRKAIDEVGYFDDVFFAYYEETDLFARMIRAGYEIIYQPKAHIWHQIAKSSKSKPYFYLYQMQRNRFIFAYKNLDNVSSLVNAYFKEGLLAVKMSLLGQKGIENKAVKDAFLWNAKNLFIIAHKRSKIKKLGPKYNEIISSYKPGTDVTVIIPSYNYAPFLKEAISSAVNQTHKPFRIIIIDDGSTDNSLEIAKSIKPARIFYDVIGKKNEGVIVTKNLGIDMSTTTWTIFLDADDTLEKNYIEKTIEKAIKTKSDVVYADSHYFGAKNEVFTADTYSSKRLIQGNFINNSALINTNLLKRTGGYKKEMHDGYEDWELYLSLAEIGAKFAKSNKTHLNYRQHSGGMSRNQKADGNGEKIRQKALSFHEGYIANLNSKKGKLKKRLKTLFKNPEIIILAPFILIYSFIRGLWEYIFAIRIRFIHITRLYLKKKKN